jgi:PAS domain S-box-containing protein
MSALATSLLISGSWRPFWLHRQRSIGRNDGRADCGRQPSHQRNLRIIINQVPRGLTDKGEAIVQVQKVLESAQTHGWRGFACVVDEDGTVVAHPNPSMRGEKVSLESYEPTFPEAGKGLDRVLDLPQRPDTEPPGIFKSSADIIAVQWLPDLMTFLCVHQPQGEIRARSDRLIAILTRIGLIFVVISASGTWVFVGWLVDRYESHLEVSELQNRTLVQSSDPIVVLNGKGEILHTNPAASRMLGVPGDHSTGLPMAGFLVDPELAVFDNPSSGSKETEYEIRTSDGRIIPVAARTCKIDYLGEGATYLLLRNMTENRRARDEILEANRKLKELDRLKSDFLNTVSHELRTPLTSIKWSTESLAGLNKNWDEETFDKLLRIIRDDNQRLTKLIEQLLSFSRLDAGQLAPKFEPFDLRELIDKAILEMSPIAEAKEISLDLVASAEIEMVADREQIRLLITNLLDNAIKYSSVDSRVSISVQPGDRMTTISITDTGIGIKEDDIDQIFGRFFRADMAEVRHETGTGLGLAIVRGILDAHGGNVEVRSQIGEGSEFKVLIPTSGGQDSESP